MLPAALRRRSGVLRLLSPKRRRRRLGDRTRRHDAHRAAISAATPPSSCTVLHDRHGGAVEIIDFAPRWRLRPPLSPGAAVPPRAPARRLPRIRMRLRPLADWGARARAHVGQQPHALRCWPTRAAPDHRRCRSPAARRAAVRARPRAALRARPGRDADASRSRAFVRDAEERTIDYWREWVRYLSIPFEWQEAVIRGAITLKLCQYEETGAIVAALTTSIPEAPQHRAQLGLPLLLAARRRLRRARAQPPRRDGDDGGVPRATSTTSSPAETGDAAAGVRHRLRSASWPRAKSPRLAGYRGMGPVRVGNLAWQQVQHDVYGSVVLASDAVVLRPAPAAPRAMPRLFARLEPLGERALRGCTTSPMPGMWEFRGRARVHTYSAVMCWAACDRLAQDRRAARPARARAATGASAPTRIRATILARRLERRARALRRTFGGDRLDARAAAARRAGLHRARDDPRFIAHRRGDRQRACKRGDVPVPLHRARRFRRAGNQRSPSARSGTSTRWPRSGARTRRARCSNACSRAATRSACCRRTSTFDDGELWGNFPQTYSHGRPDQRGDAAVAALAGRGVRRMSASSSSPTASPCRDGPQRRRARGGAAVRRCEELGGLWFGWSGKRVATSRRGHKHEQRRRQHHATSTVDLSQRGLRRLLQRLRQPHAVAAAALPRSAWSTTAARPTPATAASTRCSPRSWRRCCAPTTWSGCTTTT